MSRLDRPRAVVFDAFGTLFDVRGVDAACEAVFPGHGAEISRRWREKQLQYTWLRSLMGRYRDFEQVTSDALAAACRQLGLDLGEAARRSLIEGYRSLPCFADAPAALEALKRLGCRLAILSNGTPAQIDAVVQHAGLTARLDLLSADAVRVFKPDPRVYAIAERHFGLARPQIVFVSGNAWDVAGALSHGFTCAWLNRSGAGFEELGPEPRWRIAELTELAERLAESN